jgi:hypothetical protein
MNLTPDMILVSLALLTALLLWWEYRRENKARKWLRCLCVLVATASLGLMVYPFQKKSTTNNASTGILLTKGYHQDSLNSLQKQFPGAAVYTPETFLASGDTSISNWQVLGYGLDKSQLAPLKAQQAWFHPSPIETGIVYCNWQQELKEDEQLVVQGSCINKETKPVQIILEGYGVMQDSISLPANTRSNFILRSAVKHQGRAVFRLQVKQGSKLLENNPLPFTTSVSAKTRLLVLSSAPDFEYRFLQNWLGKAGYPSAIRTLTSRDRYEQAFINRPQISLRNISSNLLDSFDIVLADIAAIDALNETERAVIRQQIATKGMGLLLRADTISQSRFYTQGIALQSIKANTQQTILPKLVNENTPLANLPAADPTIIRINPALTSWVTDGTGKTLVAASLLGMGKIAVSTLDNTYQWLLSGQNAVYSAYWTTLLQASARQENNHTDIIAGNELYTKEQPVPVNVLHADTLLPTVRANQVSRLSLAQRSVPFLWQGVFWPSAEGWQELDAADKKRYIYIYNEQDWPMIRAIERIAITRAWARQDSHTFSPHAGGMVWKKWWFLALFLLAAGFLWVERKYFT